MLQPVAFFVFRKSAGHQMGLVKGEYSALRIMFGEAQEVLYLLLVLLRLMERSFWIRILVLVLI
jgi:hypothetical protein